MTKVIKTERENAAYIAGRLDAQTLYDLAHAGTGRSAPDVADFPSSPLGAAAAAMFSCDSLGRRREVLDACEAAGCKAYKFDAVLLALIRQPEGKLDQLSPKVSSLDWGVDAWRNMSARGAAGFYNVRKYRDIEKVRPDGFRWWLNERVVENIIFGSHDEAANAANAHHKKFVLSFLEEVS